MWNVAPVILDDEDEEALKAEFVKLSAIYHDRDAFEIAAYVFRNLRDADLRANQAAMIWQKDLEVLERIRIARLNGNKEPEEWTKEKLQSRILAVTEDESLGYQEKKARIEGYMAIAQMEGLVVKAVEKKITDNGIQQPVRLVIARYDD